MLQSCPILCDPIDGSPPGSPIPGILQARTPEWVAISFSNAFRHNLEIKGYVQMKNALQHLFRAFWALKGRIKGRNGRKMKKKSKKSKLIRSVVSDS